jgi:hypothetical protein
MLVISLITTLCTAGIAFYLRFLFALCTEFTSRWINYHKPHRLRLDKKRTIKLSPSRPPHSSAASQIIEVRLNINFHELRRDHA